MKLHSILMILLASIFVTACSNDDEPKLINSDLISGEWYMANINGWEYDEANHKSVFNYTFNFNAHGVPVGDNEMEPGKIIIASAGSDYDSDTSHLHIGSYYWSYVSQEWKLNDSGTITLKGNEMINGTLKVKITKLTDTTMTTYQKDEYGETYITYIRL